MTTAASRSLHSAPPFTPLGLLRRHPAGVWLVAGAALALALAAALDGGSVLLTWDEPIQRWVEAQRTADLGRMFRVFSRLGTNAASVRGSK